MSRALTTLTLLLCLGLAGCGHRATSPIGSATDRPPPPSIVARPPPGLRLRAPADAILGDQVVGSARRSGHDHLTAAQAASEQPDQATALRQFTSWGWLDGASRGWAGADETLVLTASGTGAVRRRRLHGGRRRRAGRLPPGHRRRPRDRGRPAGHGGLPDHLPRGRGRAADHRPGDRAPRLSEPGGVVWGSGAGPARSAG